MTTPHSIIDFSISHLHPLLTSGMSRPQPVRQVRHVQPDAASPIGYPKLLSRTTLQGFRAWADALWVTSILIFVH